jgi:hypothetical protein
MQALGDGYDFKARKRVFLCSQGINAKERFGRKLRTRVRVA